MVSSKYYKPNSMTWWVAVTQVMLGLILAISANVPTLAVLHGIFSDLTGGLPAYGLIMSGLGGIGLRGAIK